MMLHSRLLPSLRFATCAIAFFGLLHMLPSLSYAAAGPAQFDKANTPFALSLTGVILTAKHPLAVIDVNGKQSVYTIGDRLTNGSAVAAISGDRITLVSNGVETVLHMSGRRVTQSPEVRRYTLPINPGNAKISPSTPDITRAPASVESAATKNTVTPGATSSAWVIPNWLQAGLSGPTASDDIAKSPWEKEKSSKP